jgi:hypothetical protein
MLESLKQIRTKVVSSDYDEQETIQIIQTYWNALKQVKRQVLRCGDAERRRKRKGNAEEGAYSSKRISVAKYIQ